MNQELAVVRGEYVGNVGISLDIQRLQLSTITRFQKCNFDVKAACSSACVSGLQRTLLLLLLNLVDGQPVRSDEANPLLTLPGPISLLVKASKAIAFLEIL
jgi:hypothetical protein